MLHWKNSETKLEKTGVWQRGSAVIPIALALIITLMSFTLVLSLSHRRSAMTARSLEEGVIVHHLLETTVHETLEAINSGLISSPGTFNPTLTKYSGYTVLPIEVIQDENVKPQYFRVEIDGSDSRRVKTWRWQVKLKFSSERYGVDSIGEISES